MELNEIGREVVDAAIKAHSALGPGLLENAYEACLKHELNFNIVHLKDGIRRLVDRI